MNGFRMILCLSCWLVATSTVQAWTKAGHMVVGAITYHVLKQEDPEALAKAVAILRAHPQYNRLWKSKVDRIPAEEQDLYLFMLAGRWADDIRGTPEYDQPTWHYTNGYYKHPAAPDTVVLPVEGTGDAIPAYEKNFERLRTATDPSEQAVPLCWVSHLVGDIHMPMHTVSMFSEQYPEGDRGGNLCFIRARPDSRGINLHAFWDGLIIGSDNFRDCRNQAIVLRLRDEFAEDKLTELRTTTTYREWIEKESNPIAKKYVYLDGKLKVGTGEFNAVLLPEGYIERSKAIAERRGVLAGYRLARVIKDALNPTPTNGQPN